MARVAADVVMEAGYFRLEFRGQRYQFVSASFMLVLHGLFAFFVMPSGFGDLQTHLHNLETNTTK